MTQLEHRFSEASKDAWIARMEASCHTGSAHYALEDRVWQERIAIAHGMKPNIWRKS